MKRDRSQYSKEDIDSRIFDAQKMSEQDKREAALDIEHFGLKCLYQNVISYIDHERAFIEQVMSSSSVDAIRDAAQQSSVKLDRATVRLGQHRQERKYYQDRLRPVFFSGSGAPCEYPKFLTF